MDEGVVEALSVITSENKSIRVSMDGREGSGEADPGATGARRGTTKAERGPEAIQSIRRHGAAYLVAVGGAAYLLSKAIRRARVLAFEDLGMEAIHEFELADFPPSRWRSTLEARPSTGSLRRNPHRLEAERRSEPLGLPADRLAPSSTSRQHFSSTNSRRS